MPPFAELPLPIAAAGGVLLVAIVAEKLHQRRCRVVARLAMGPAGRPRAWVAWVPAVKATALGALAWSLATLILTHGGAYRPSGDLERRREHRHHLVFVADLSPSMHLRDAGPGRDQTRTQRMRDVVDAVLQRVGGDVIYSVIAFYTDAMPVIVDTDDAELVRNVFDGLPIWYAMESGKTDLGTGVRKAVEHLKGYPEGNTTVFLCTDGDTVGLGSLPKRPPAARDVYVLGVGDPRQGTFIDGHMSRQEAPVLSTLAGRLRGTYLDVNEKHVPTLTLGSLAAPAGTGKHAIGLVDLAIYVFAAAAAVLAAIPVLLEYFGSDWRPVRVERRALDEGARA
jgi:Ca-activated chloride channel homolog